MKHKRFTALLLITAMTTLALTGCVERGNNNPVSSGSFTEGDKTFTAADFDGVTFTFLSVSPDAAYYNGEWIDSEGYTGESTNNAVYERNLAVEENYNLSVETICFSDENEIVPEVMKYFQAGDICFDAIYGWAIRLGSLVPEGYFYDFNKVPYIDLSQEYWCPASARDDLTVAGKTYLMINDISMNKLAWGEFLFFNKQILEDLNLTSPHDYVESNNWTIDTFLEMVQSVHIELDGQNDFTHEDRFGLLYGSIDLLSSCGMFLTTKNPEDGSYSLNMGSEAYMNLQDKIEKVMNNKQYVFSYGDVASDGGFPEGFDQYSYPRYYFATGHCLFTGGTACITNEFRNMEDSYGVVPAPKLSSDQENYITNINTCANIFAIPNNTPESLEKAGIILEYMAYKSNELLLPAYYEKTLKTQRMNDKRDQEMLDLIKDSIRYEWSDIAFVTTYSTDTTFEGNPLRFVSGQMKRSRSSFDRYKSKVTKIIDDYYDKMKTLT